MPADNETTPDADYDKGPVVLALTTVTTSLALLAVGTRLFVRVRIVKNVGWDDYAILLAVAMAIIVMVFEILSVSHGNGRHQHFLAPADIVEASKWSRATIPPNLMACLLARVSLCLFMMRIVDRVKAYQIVLWTVIALNFVTTSASIIQLLASCKPLEKLWNPPIPGHCFPAKVTTVVGLTQATSAIASDWIVALLPILIVRNLNMALRTKIALSILMSTGVFVGVAALVKTLQLYTLGKRIDVTWDTFNLTCWSIVEQNLGIIAVSVAAIRPLFRHFFKMGTRGPSNNPNRYLGGGSDRSAGYEFGNMVGRSRGTVYPNDVTIMSNSARRKQGPRADDDTGSESNLVEGKVSDMGITKTVSVHLENDVRIGGGKGGQWGRL